MSASTTWASRSIFRWPTADCGRTRFRAASDSCCSVGTARAPIGCTMPEVNTRHFGIISFEDDAVIQFPQGLPAFESATRFVLIEQAAASPLIFLQSLDDPQLSFVAAPV